MRSLICGIGGQDGSYLARHLLGRNHEVVGTSRDARACSFGNLERLGILGQVKTRGMAIDDFEDVLRVLRQEQPDEIYNLAGQTSVGISFQQPLQALESIANGTLHLLEAIRILDRPIRLYQAGSSECFGHTSEGPANESTAFKPRSPYAVAKCSAHWLVRTYRESYGVLACTGLAFNHESPLRPPQFVLQKAIHAAAAIASGQDLRLRLGNIEIERDWGWAPDYVEAMERMLRLEPLQDLVIATGRSVSLRHLVECAFAEFDLDWSRHVDIDPGLFRPNEIPSSQGDPSLARNLLGWRHRLEAEGVVAAMCDDARERFRHT